MENKKLQYNCKLLVKSVTHFEEKDKNFKTCVDFAASNLLHHNYLDVNSHNVEKKISRWQERYYIQSNLHKAEYLQSISRKLIDIFSNKTPNEREAGYRVLALILHLAESCDSQSNFKLKYGASSDKGYEDTSFADLIAQLHEDDINCNYFSDTESEIDVSFNDSSLSDNSSLDNLPDAFPHPPTRDDSGLGISPDSCSSQPFQVQLVAPESIESRNKKNPSTFYPYWLPKHQKEYGSCQYNLRTVNFTKIWHDYVVSKTNYNLIERKVIVHERNVIKEILWMLNGIKELFIVLWDGKKFTANPQVHLLNITSNTLGTVLNEFCDYATKKDILTDFIHCVLFENRAHSLTYQAYANSIKEQIEKINDSICNLEKSLRKGCNTFTLLTLRKRIKDVFHEIDVLYHLHCEVLTETSNFNQHSEKACKVLHTLWNELHHQSVLDPKSDALKITFRIFLKSCQPYFNFIEELIVLGSFHDPFEEFIVKREDVPIKDEFFWDKGYTFRIVPRDTEQEFFLKSFFSDILCGGKSFEITHAINSLLKRKPFQMKAQKGDMYTLFIQSIETSVGSTQSSNHSTECDESAAEVSSEQDLSLVPIKDPLLDQFPLELNNSIAKFFLPGVNPVYKPVCWKVREELLSVEFRKREKILDSLEPGLLKPLSHGILQAVTTCMESVYYPVCKHLIASLREDYRLMDHLAVMRRYFLMESGDLMFSFYTVIFYKVFHQENWKDVVALNDALQSAFAEDKENVEKLSISLDSENPEINTTQPLSQLNVIKLSFKVEWPMTMILGSRLQNQYRQIFSFLLELKCAKYFLDELYKTDPCPYKMKLPSQLMQSFMKKIFPRKQKIHGMYILRMRLMFFVNGLHNYIMTRILHSFSLEFVDVLESARTVDEMMSTHEKYLKSLQERCLLDRRITYIKEPILQVLNLCHTLQRLWLMGIDKIRLEDLQSIENQFSKFSNFLLCCFNTPLRRGTYLHLESLVSTMLSSTHSFHIFST